VSEAASKDAAAEPARVPAGAVTLRELRRERGWTQRRLARVARVSARTVHWEDHEMVFGPLGSSV